MIPSRNLFKLICRKHWIYKFSKILINSLLCTKKTDVWRIGLIEDKGINKIVGTGTIIIEHKLIRNNGKVANIEDIVIDEEYRNYGLGKMLIECLTEYAKIKNCYKCILDCSVDNVIFYEKCGYTNKGIQMSYYF